MVFLTGWLAITVYVIVNRPQPKKGMFIPAVFLSGLQVNWNQSGKRDEDDWSGVVRIDFFQEDCEIGIYVNGDGGGDTGWAVGRAVRELRG